MKSFEHIGLRPVSLPLSADDILEFHAARILLLLQVCGISGRIDGLTKMAKLDFFSRYPSFFEAARGTNQKTNHASPPNIGIQDRPVEAAMIRHHYGPWDKRYYHVLAYLEAKRLISIRKINKTYEIALTDTGKVHAKELEKLASFYELITHMRNVKKVFGRKSGNALKNLIYQLFGEEVRDLPLGEVIKQ